MEQYYAMSSAIIETPNGGPKEVIDFRTRLQYTYFDESKVMESELLRIDLLGLRLVQDIAGIGQLIDANDKDIFSFEANEKIMVGIS